MAAVRLQSADPMRGIVALQASPANDETAVCFAMKQMKRSHYVFCCES